MAGVYGANPFAAAGEDMRLQDQHKASAFAQSNQSFRPTPVQPKQPASGGGGRGAAQPPNPGAAAAKEKHDAWLKSQMKEAAATPAKPTASTNPLGASSSSSSSSSAASAAAASAPPSSEEQNFQEPSWQKDQEHTNCACCQRRFDTFFRRHHCRGCGIIFCSNCTPPPKLMLPRHWEVREPQRVCVSCAAQLNPLQPSLVEGNSNAGRSNDVFWGGQLGVRRYFNKPVAFTLGGEIRKAAHSVNNIMTGLESALVDDHSMQAEAMRDAKGLLFLTVGKVAFGAGFHVGSGLIVVRLGEKNTSTQHDQQQQHPSGGGGSGGGGGKRGGSTPEGVLSGLVKDWQGGGGGVQWSAPCAVGMFGLSVGIEAGLETTDMVIPITDGGAVAAFAKGTRHLTLGREMGFSLGMLGRKLTKQRMSTTTKDRNSSVHVAKSYSHSRGAYGGVSLQGTVVTVRRDVNLDFYGREVNVTDLFWGKVQPPAAADVLYKKLDDYRVWSGNASIGSGGGPGGKTVGGMRTATSQQETYDAL